MNNEAKIYGGIDITAARRAQRAALRKAQEKGLRDPKCNLTRQRELSRIAFADIAVVPQIEATPLPDSEVESDCAFSSTSADSAFENSVVVDSPEVWRKALQTKDALSAEGTPLEDKA